MAHFARIKNGVVDFVTVGRDDDENREDELAHDGYIYRRTSYNTRGGVHYTDGQPSADQSKAFRKNYAGLGYTFDSERDAFISPKPFASWVLDEQTCLWNAPVAMPEDAGTANPPSDTRGMKQPPRGSSKVLSGSNNHPRRLYCCMERDKKGIRVCSGGRGRLESTK
jgi:hypothetical protein